MAKGHGEVTQPISPAHNLVGEQHSAHFGVLVLPFIDDGLGEGKCAGWRERSSSGVQAGAEVGLWVYTGISLACMEERSCPLEKIMPSSALLWRSPGVQSKPWRTLRLNQDHHGAGGKIYRFCLSAAMGLGVGSGGRGQVPYPYPERCSPQPPASFLSRLFPCS